MSQVYIRDGVAHVTVGAGQPTEAKDMALGYLARRGWVTNGEVDVTGGHRAKVGVSGLRVWRVHVPVVRR